MLAVSRVRSRVSGAEYTTGGRVIKVRCYGRARAERLHYSHETPAFDSAIQRQFGMETAAGNMMVFIRDSKRRVLQSHVFTPDEVP